eukprot:2243325-Heterocapsa_arctica.AAC.1
MCRPVGGDGALSSLCRDAGIRICTGQGAQLYRFRNALLRQMKASFKEPSKRNLLAEGFVVAHLILHQWAIGGWPRLWTWGRWHA